MSNDWSTYRDFGDVVADVRPAGVLEVPLQRPAEDLDEASVAPAGARGPETIGVGEVQPGIVAAIARNVVRLTHEPLRKACSAARMACGVSEINGKNKKNGSIRQEIWESVDEIHGSSASAGGLIQIQRFMISEWFSIPPTHLLRL